MSTQWTRSAAPAAPERLPPPGLSLDEPGTIEFTAERALAGRSLNRFAMSLRAAARRAEFLADELDYMQKAELSAVEMKLVQERDWTGLLRAGGHLRAILTLAATVGQDLWAIGAHNADCSRSAMIAACPRQVTGLPRDVG